MSVILDALKTILNELYNAADCTINIANNEGFGLTTAESIMAGTPIIVNVTGGLQDQCGFGYSADDYIQIESLHDLGIASSLTFEGEWAVPVFPAAVNLNGSPVTPYIFDDKVDYADVAPLIREWYDMGREGRKAAGLRGREWMIGEGGLSVENMCKTMSDGIDSALQNFQPREKYELFTV